MFFNNAQNTNQKGPQNTNQKGHKTQTRRVTKLRQEFAQIVTSVYYFTNKQLPHSTCCAMMMMPTTKFCLALQLGIVLLAGWVAPVS